MQQSRVGSFSVSQIMDLLHVSKVTAYEISKLPQLKRRLVGKRYRILKADFWDWYNSQSTYQAYEEDFNFEEFFTSADIAEMFGWETNSVYKFIIKNNLKSDLCRTQFLVKKDSFIDWYIHQFRYTSDDPRLPPKVVTPTYDIHQVKKILGITKNRTVYHIYNKNYFNVLRVENRTLVEKESFDKWFDQQDRYPAVRRKRNGINNRKER